MLGEWFGVTVWMVENMSAYQDVECIDLTESNDVMATF
jgi:hypothetical protein